ncbi:hypothetical protein PR048_025844 [Dryococelus australis]|uniref:Uncharacterized protein n=1 Tax=Dryococelus australis TaxID=614101 RepID=A0ABQ9GJP6_9NEOP|nr:hypothetical protein PR048_025844 [Dryococelus australis]
MGAVLSSRLFLVKDRLQSRRHKTLDTKRRHKNTVAMCKEHQKMWVQQTSGHSWIIITNYKQTPPVVHNGNQSQCSTSTHTRGGACEEWTALRGRTSGHSAIVKVRGQLPELMRRRSTSGRRGHHKLNHSRVTGAAVAERLACSPPTEAKRVQSPTGSLPDFRKWESLVGGFSRGSPISLPLTFRRCSILTSAGMQGWGKREVPEKTRRPAASSGTISTSENPGVILPGIEPDSPWSEEFYFKDFENCAGTRILLASHQSEQSSILGRVTPGFSYVVIVPDEAAGRRVFSRFSRFPRPCILALPHAHFNHPHRLSRPRC